MYVKITDKDFDTDSLSLLIFMKKIRSDILKIIAMVCMFIDHFGAGLIEPMFMKASSYEGAMRLYNIDLVLRGIGRLAFPIFAYQIVVGMKCTSSRIKYIRNLFIFGIVTEVFYDLLFQNSTFDMSDQNVYFTLLFGAFGIFLYELIEEKIRASLQGIASTILNSIIFVVIFGALAYVGYCFNTDYDARGVIFIAIMYLFRNNIVLLVTMTPILFMAETIVIKTLTEGGLANALTYAEFEIYACISFLLIYRDSGERRGGKVLKWIGYAFYPAHLFLIYLIRVAVLGG